MSRDPNARGGDHALMLIRQWQSPTEEIRHTPEARAVRLTLFGLALALAAGVAVTPFLRLDRMVRSEGGEIVSRLPLSTVQALDPSIIRTVDVKEGQQVRKGQLLATLDPTFASAETGQLAQQIAGFDAEIARATAEKAGAVYAPPASPAPGAAMSVDMQRALYGQRAAQFAALRTSLDEKVRTAEATLKKLGGNEDGYVEREGLTRRIEDMRTTLYHTGTFSLVDMLTANDARLQLLQARDDGQSAIVQARHRLTAAEADRDAFLHGWSVSLAQELVAAQGQRDDAGAALEKARRHQDLVRITAPEDEVVLSLSRLSVGSVLNEGDELMRLAPLDAPVEAEIRIAARNVGAVRTGDPVTLAIDAFDVHEAGQAEGHLTWISEGAFVTDRDGQPTDPYYKARASIDALHFVGVPAGFRLVPGMTLKGEVKVGTRSVFRYVMGGFFRDMGEGMRTP